MEKLKTSFECLFLSSLFLRRFESPEHLRVQRVNADQGKAERYTQSLYQSPRTRPTIHTHVDIRSKVSMCVYHYHKAPSLGPRYFVSYIYIFQKQRAVLISASVGRILSYPKKMSPGQVRYDVAIVSRDKCKGSKRLKGESRQATFERKRRKMQRAERKQRCQVRFPLHIFPSPENSPAPNNLIFSKYVNNQKVSGWRRVVRTCVCV